MDQKARVNFNAWVEVWVTPDDIGSWSGYEEALRSGMSREEILTAVANEKISNLDPNGQHGVAVNAEGASIDNDTLNWDELLHPAAENPNVPQDAIFDESDHRARPPKESLNSKKEADSNPAQKMAQEALKIAKELSNLLNSLAGLQDRETIAQVAGLTELPDAIDRLYEYADRMRGGDVQQLQPAYAGWDIEKLRRNAQPFVDSNSKPIQTVSDPAEVNRFERERISCPNCAGTAAEACSHL